MNKKKYTFSTKYNSCNSTLVKEANLHKAYNL